MRKSLVLLAALLALGLALHFLRGGSDVPSRMDDLPPAFAPRAGAPAPSSMPAAGAPAALPAADAPIRSAVHFSPRTRELVAAIESGIPLRLRIGAARARELLLTPAPYLADSFAINLGERPGNAPAASVRLFSGVTPATRFAVRTAGHACADGCEHAGGPGPGAARYEPFANVVLAVVDGAASLEISEPDGQYTQARLHPEDGGWRAVEWRTDDFAFRCSYEQTEGGGTVAALKVPRHPAPGDWDRRAVAATVEPAPGTAAMVNQPGDLDPTTGQYSLSQARAPWGPRYDATLKKVYVIWAANKFNTGAATPENLAYKASMYLALFAHSAATYEYQMGFRNLLQEMILVPDDPAYEDFSASGSAGSKLDNFRIYINTHRPQGTYGWQTACGAPNYIYAGLAWLPVFPGSYSVNISDPWHYVVNMHEHGHNFAAGHTQGGIMNPYVSDSWNFHNLREGSTNRTAAHEMYDWCNPRGTDTGLLRSPYDMPFARHDAQSTPVNTPLTFDPRTNDFTKTTARTNDNELAIEEVSQLLPPAAGAVAFTPASITFTPANGYQGVAWFSYSLRGNIGNNGQGHLHRATVAITVGSDTRQAYALSVPAGKAVEFVPGVRPTGIVSQPAQALATVAVGGYGGSFFEIGVRAEPTATGADQFVFSSSSGNKTVDVTYTTAEGLVARDDFIPDNSYAGGLRIAPLANDEGTGERSTVIDTRIILGIETNGTPGAVQDFFDDHFGLAERTDLDVAKGTSVLDRVTLYGDTGVAVSNSGYLTFHRLQTGGVARIDYVATDALGQSDGGRVHVILPMATLVSPSDNPAASVSVHEETKLVLDGQVHASSDFPLTGAPVVEWSRFYGPAGIAFDDATSPDTVASFSQPGSYVARLTATDNGYATWRQARVTVRAASELPVSENLGGYAVRSPILPFIVTDTYSLANLVQSVVDDGKSGLPFVTAWSKLSGPGTVTFGDPAVPGTTALFSSPGTYTLRLGMDDGKVRTAQDFDLLYDADSDGDSLPDSWEQHFFGNLNNGPNDNPADGDSHSLLREFVAGSSPADTNRLDFLGVRATSNGTISVRWNSRQTGPGPARLYQFLETGGYYRDGLTWTSRAAHVAATGPETTQSLPWAGSTRAMRLFRVAVYAGITSRTDRVAGVLRAPLVVGQNYVSLPLSADAGTVAELIPTNLLPGADNETSAITLSQWDPQTQTLTPPIWLSRLPAYPGWRQSGSFNDANGTVLDPARGLVLTLRAAHGSRPLYLAGMVPTNASTAVSVAGGGYTLAGVPYPAEVTLANSGLLAAGFQGGTGPGTSDQLLFFSETAGAFTTRVWYDTATSQWRDAATFAISSKTLVPGQPVLIRRRGAGGFTWTMQRPYALP